MSRLDHKTKLAMGVTFLYPINVENNYFLGMVDEYHWHLIKCFSKEDCERRIDTLLESEFYELGGYHKEVQGLIEQAKKRNYKPTVVKHIGINRTSKLPSLSQWNEEAIEDINERREVNTKAAMGNA